MDDIAGELSQLFCPGQSADLTSDGWPIPPAKHLADVKALPPHHRIILEVRNKNQVDVPNEIGIFDLTTHTESRWDVLETALHHPSCVRSRYNVKAKLDALATRHRTLYHLGA
jgi:hypothetical protein